MCSSAKEVVEGVFLYNLVEHLGFPKSPSFCRQKFLEKMLFLMILLCALLLDVVLGVKVVLVGIVGYTTLIYFSCNFLAFC